WSFSDCSLDSRVAELAGPDGCNALPERWTDELIGAPFTALWRRQCECCWLRTRAGHCIVPVQKGHSLQCLLLAGGGFKCNLDFRSHKREKQSSVWPPPERFLDQVAVDAELANIGCLDELNLGCLVEVNDRAALVVDDVAGSNEV